LKLTIYANGPQKAFLFDISAAQSYSRFFAEQVANVWNNLRYDVILAFTRIVDLNLIDFPVSQTIAI